MNGGDFGVQLQELLVFRDGACKIARLLLLHGILHQLLRGYLSLRDADEARARVNAKEERASAYRELFV